MKRLLGLMALGAAVASAADCDRACLKNVMTTYLSALVAQDPGKAPLAGNVRFTEDSKELKVGEGFWKTATKVGDYRQDFVDVKEQMIASHVLMEEGAQRALFTARLKVAKGKITEIETLVTHTGERTYTGNALISRPDMGVEPPKDKRMKRQEMIKIADAYPRGLTIGGFDKADVPFSINAFRIENGFVMAGEGCGRGTPSGGQTKAGAPAAAPVTGGAVSARAPQDVAGCLNIKTQKIIEHPALVKSTAVVDEEQGVVLTWMNFGDTGTYGEGKALICFEAFKVYGGQMHAVQAFLKIVPKDTQRGWGKTVKGLE